MKHNCGISSGKVLIAVMMAGVVAASHAADSSSSGKAHKSRVISKITREEATLCSKELNRLRRAAIAHFQNRVSTYCDSNGRFYSTGNCTNTQKWVNTLESMSDIDYYWKGECSDNSSLCFGVPYLPSGDKETEYLKVRTTWERPTPEEELQLQMFENKQEAEFHYTSAEADACVAKLLLAKLEGKKISVPLSEGQAADCDSDIMDKQLESQSWKGSTDEIAVRLARYQKKLFEGRCAGHPEVVSYLEGADEMLSLASSAKGKPSPKKSTQHTNEENSKIVALEHDQSYDATSCLSLANDSLTLYGGFNNSCNYKISYSFCAYHPKKDSWVEVFDCEKQKFGADIIGPNGRQSSHTKGAEAIHWAACMYEDAGGNYVDAGPRNIVFDAQRTAIIFSCYKNGKKPRDPEYKRLP